MILVHRPVQGVLWISVVMQENVKMGMWLRLLFFASTQIEQCRNRLVFPQLGHRRRCAGIRQSVQSEYACLHGALHRLQPRLALLDWRWRTSLKLTANGRGRRSNWQFQAIGERETDLKMSICSLKAGCSACGRTAS
jgi:hypothetical protein